MGDFEIRDQRLGERDFPHQKESTRGAAHVYDHVPGTDGENRDIHVADTSLPTTHLVIRELCQLIEGKESGLLRRLQHEPVLIHEHTARGHNGARERICSV